MTYEPLTHYQLRSSPREKVKSTMPREERWWGAHLPYLGREPV